MAQNERILDRVQIGFEGTPGTAVAATRKMYARMDPAGGVSAPLLWYDDATGTYQNRRRATRGRTTVAWPMTDLVTFEDIHYWLCMMVEGTAAETTGTDPSALVHTFEPDLDTDTLRSATVEWGDPGNVYEVSQAYMNSWTLRGDSDNDNELAWMLEADFVGREFVTSTFTALPDRTTEVVTARGTELFIDPSSAAIGTTQVTGKLINWSITGTINRHTKAFAEDEQFVAQGVTGRQAWMLDAQLTFEFDDDTEFANYRAGDPPVQRAIRLSRAGSAIAGMGDTHLLQVDLFGFWSAVSTGDREGNKTITLTLEAGHDVTAATDSTFTVINTQAAIP